MVYFSPEQLVDGENLPFSVAGGGNVAGTLTPREPTVIVSFNGTGLHKIAGPTPFVNFSKSYNRNGAGIVENIQTNVTINGKIVRAPVSPGAQIPELMPPGTGTEVLLGAVKNLQQLFSCTAGLFQVKCNGSPPESGITISGARVNSFNINKSEDNWVFTADYEVQLEYNEPGISGAPPVKNTVDSWNIEPLEDYIYTRFSVQVSGKPEYSNPMLKPGAPTNGAPTAGTNTLDIINIPQYKISRRLSAVGFPIMSGLGSGCYSPSGNYTAYLQARDWVQYKLAESFKASTSANNFPSGLVSWVENENNVFFSSLSKVYLFNHLRTINFSVSEGSYEVNETWLAMPTGIGYVEDYSLETSTDERYIKRVRVQGNIKGLSFTPINIMSGSSGLIPTGIQPARIGLDHTISSGSEPYASVPKILDNFTQTSAVTQFQGAKYLNALSGWVNDIKPYLYRRASLVLNNAPDRNEKYLSPTTEPPPDPKNPIYCKENFLNVIPISTTEGHDPRKGTISYSYEYSNRFVFISGALSENFTITDTGPTDVINETFVLGRRLGPILQALGTRSAAKRDLTIEVAVLPPSSMAGFVMTSKECPLWTGGTVYKTITGMIEGLKPYGDRTVSIFGNMGSDTRTGGQTNNPGQVYVNQDNQTWNPVEGRYTRQIGWTYQPCTIARSYLDT